MQRVYKDQMSKLDILQHQVEKSLERLRSETAHFQDVNLAIQDQREKLRSTFEDMERNRDIFLAKGKFFSMLVVYILKKI